MGWPQNWGWVLFLLVPGILWIIGALANRGGDIRDRIFGFAVGTDGRLSLSRLQAFLWTLVIFGSFAAAMCVHKKISPGSPTEVNKRSDDAKAAADRASAAKVDYDAAIVNAKAAAAKKQSDRLAADNAVFQAARWQKEGSNAPPGKIDEAKSTAMTLSVQADGSDNNALKAEQTRDTAQKAWEQAKKDADTADAAAKAFDWVKIPDALLALAGIAVGAGVFSNLISTVSSDDKTAKITAVRSIPKAKAAQAANFHAPANTGDPHNSNYLVLDGTDFGMSGSVRLVRNQIGKDIAPILAWATDGTQIVLDVADGLSYSRIVLDTPNGKVVHEVSGQTPNLVLGVARPHYEFADLFRDDKHPGTMDLMKFQMFGWTMIAVSIYVFLFLVSLSDTMTSLPTVDSSIVILTGISQAAYLTGKGVSNVPAKP